MRTEDKAAIKQGLRDLGTLLLFFFAVFLTGYRFGVVHERRKAEGETPAVKVDTLWRVDTVKVPHPVPVDRWLTRTEYVPVPDTVLVQRNDTTFVPVPIETTRYEGPDYEAWVSGFQATLDSINIFRPTAVVEKQVPVYLNKKWGIGLQAGVTWSKDTKITPYVGVGLSYNLISF